MVDYMNARGTCPDCGEFRDWADGPPHKCPPKEPTNLNEWAGKCHRASVTAGWWVDYSGNDPTFLAMKIALIHSEVSEALEGIRKNNLDNHLPNRMSVEVELADTLIRIFDLAGALSCDLEGAVHDKMEYNNKRADHKKEARDAKDGKAF